MRSLLLIAGVCTLASAQPLTTLRLNPEITLDLIDLPGRPALSFARTPVTMEQFRAFIEATGHITDAENPQGNGPNRIGGHGWNADRKRPEGWFPRYTWRYTGWPLTDKHPVSNISWNDASKFCEWLNGKTGRPVRLPTTAEWTRAAQAGTTSAYFTGESVRSVEGYGNVADQSLLRAMGVSDYADGGFPFDDGYPFTSPVAAFKPNSLGLYDMLGNVFQWCSDSSRPTWCGCSYKRWFRHLPGTACATAR